jgi:heme-degrading monooxygenase HmoA
MPWVQIQKAAQATWDDYAQVQHALEEGGGVPDGLIYHAAGEQPNGRWQSVSVWESEDAFNRFRDERILPAVRQALGDEMADAGPPPAESFEAKHVLTG